MNTALAAADHATYHDSSSHYARLLFTTDFSATSLQALPLAAAIARTFASELHLLYALTPDAYVFAVSEFTPTGASITERDARARLNEIKFSDELQGVTVAAPAVFRRGLNELSQKIACDEIDLVVMATHGSKGFRHLLLGSVTEDVIRTSPCPVLTMGPHVRLNSDAEFYPQHVLFATDATPDSFRALPHAMFFAKKAGCGLTLVHVLPKGHEGSLEANAFAALLQDGLHRALPLTAIRECNPEIAVCFGNPVEEILNIARERESGLIVMGARSNANKATFSRSVSYGMIAEANCPVLTVRGKE